MTKLITYAAGLATLVVGDLLWLGVLMRSFYADKLGHLMAPTVNWWAAGLFYLAYTFAVWWFVVSPSVGKALPYVAMQGALFGALVYAVYDLTNQATLRDWPLQITLIDIAWGTFLTTVMSLMMAMVRVYMAQRG